MFSSTVSVLNSIKHYSISRLLSFQQTPINTVTNIWNRTLSDKMAANCNANIKTFVFFDLESTGLPSPGNNPRITELSLVGLTREELLSRSSGPRVLNKLTLCFNPRKRIHHQSTQITGLHNDSLELLRSFSQQARLVTLFLEQLPQPACLLAHNGNRFDFPLLMAELQKANTGLPEGLLCADSLEAFRMFDRLPAVPEWKLKKFAEKKNLSAKQNNLSAKQTCSSNATTPSKSSSPESASQGPWEQQERTPSRKAGLKIEETRPEKKSSESKPKPVLFRRKLFPNKDGVGDVSSPDAVSVVVVGDDNDEITDSEKDLIVVAKEVEAAHSDSTSCDSKEVNIVSSSSSTDSEVELIEETDKCSNPIILNQQLKVSVNTSLLNGNSDVTTTLASSDTSEDQKVSEIHTPKTTPNKWLGNKDKCDVKTPENKKKLSYSLINVYQRVFGQQPAVSHNAEDDCITMLKIIRVNPDQFVKWCDDYAKPLREVDPMYK